MQTVLHATCDNEVPHFMRKWDGMLHVILRCNTWENMLVCTKWKWSGMWHTKMPCNAPWKNVVQCLSWNIKSNKRPVSSVWMMFAQVWTFVWEFWTNCASKDNRLCAKSCLTLVCLYIPLYQRCATFKYTLPTLGKYCCSRYNSLSARIKPNLLKLGESADKVELKAAKILSVQLSRRF